MFLVYYFMFPRIYRNSKDGYIMWHLRTAFRLMVRCVFKTNNANTHGIFPVTQRKQKNFPFFIVVNFKEKNGLIERERKN